MSMFSREFEKDFLDRLNTRVDERVNFIIEHHNPIGLMPKKEVMEILGISSKTLEDWERQGLKRFAPPLGGKKVFYDPKEVYYFLDRED